MGYDISVAYYTTNHGVTQQQKGIDATYYGKTFKIPKADFSNDGNIDLQRDIQELMAELQDNELEPIFESATVERYETWSANGEEVWVMYRIPCKQK